MVSEDVAIAHSAEPAPAAAWNPLLRHLERDPVDPAILIQLLKRLPPGEEAAHWVDQLLDDPRVERLPQVREEAVRTLLEFGHPWALLINHQDLARFRQQHPSDIRPRLVAVGAAVGILGAFAAPSLVAQELGAVALAGIPLFWVLSVKARALLRIGLTRPRLIIEVLLGLTLSVLTLEAGAPAGAAAMLAAAVPVALAGLAGGWSES